MVNIRSISYPYLAVAQHFDVPYANVLDYVGWFERSVPGSIRIADTAPQWVHATLAAFDREMDRRAVLANADVIAISVDILKEREIE